MTGSQRLTTSPSTRLAAMLVVLAAAGRSATAQPTVQTAPFTPGNQVLFATTFAQDSLGSFPANLRHLKGPLDVVVVNGARMLRAVGPAEFLIPLSQPLPQDFTLEFDFIARTGAGHEIGFEGGPVASRSIGSAEVLWNHQVTTIMGGGLGMAQLTLPYDLQAQLVGRRALVQVMITGTQFKLFTNGRQQFNVPNLAFRRSTSLRIYLGGVNDNTQAMYLAGIRLATNGPTVVTTMASPTATTTPQPASPPSQPAPPPPPASPQPQPGSATGTPKTGGTILSGGPTTKLPLSVVPPPLVSTTPGGYNQPTQYAPVQAGQSQTTQPAPATPFVAGPTELGGAPWPLGPDFMANGVGFVLIWSAVPSATSYRVYRTVLGSPLPAQPHLTVTEAEATAIASDHGSSGAYRVVVDPFMTAANVYWVDAIFSDGSISGLSPSFTMVVPPPTGFMAWPIGVVKNLKPTFGPSTTVTTWDGKVTMPGRTVSWNWTPLPAALLYEIQIDFGTPGGVALPVPTYSGTLLTTQAPVLSLFGTSPLPSVLAPLGTRGLRTGPPFTMGVPTGMIVRFCVGILRDYSNPANPLPPQYSACDTSVVP